MEQDIRWKQRFESFSDALKHLQNIVVEVREPSDLEKEYASIVQCYYRALVHFHKCTSYI